MDVPDLMRSQCGVVSRCQVRQRGMGDHDIARMLRRREWARLYYGVYVDHTGEPTWHQRAWGATLLHSPAALSGASALRSAGLTIGRPEDPIDLVVAAHRRVEDPPGVRTRRTRAWDAIVQPHRVPLRVRLEPAALTVASESACEDAAVAVLADVCQQRRTTPLRLMEALDLFPRLPRRRLLSEVLADASDGAMSALERRYLCDVERAHGLPAGQRQLRVRREGRTHVRDVDYVVQAVILELDGRVGHELSRDRWRDLERDLLNLVHGSLTVRVGWLQVLDPCRLADAVSRLLQLRGWGGTPRRCGPGCPVR